MQGASRSNAGEYAYARYLLSSASEDASSSSSRLRLLPTSQINSAPHTHPLRPPKGGKRPASGGGGGTHQGTHQGGGSLSSYDHMPLTDLTFEVANWCSDAEMIGPDITHTTNSTNGSSSSKRHTTKGGVASMGDKLPSFLRPHHRGTSLLHVCAYTDHLEGVRLLISDFAEVDARTYTHELGVHLGLYWV